MAQNIPIKRQKSMLASLDLRLGRTAEAMERVMDTDWDDYKEMEDEDEERERAEEGEKDVYTDGGTTKEKKKEKIVDERCEDCLEVEPRSLAYFGPFEEPAENFLRLRNTSRGRTIFVKAKSTDTSLRADPCIFSISPGGTQMMTAMRKATGPRVGHKDIIALQVTFGDRGTLPAKVFAEKSSLHLKTVEVRVILISEEGKILSDLKTFTAKSKPQPKTSDLPTKQTTPPLRSMMRSVRPIVKPKLTNSKMLEIAPKIVYFYRNDPEGTFELTEWIGALLTVADPARYEVFPPVLVIEPRSSVTATIGRKKGRKRVHQEQKSERDREKLRILYDEVPAKTLDPKPHIAKESHQLRVNIVTSANPMVHVDPPEAVYFAPHKREQVSRHIVRNLAPVPIAIKFMLPGIACYHRVLPVPYAIIEGKAWMELTILKKEWEEGTRTDNRVVVGVMYAPSGQHKDAKTALGAVRLSDTQELKIPITYSANYEITVEPSNIIFPVNGADPNTSEHIVCNQSRHKWIAIRVKCSDNNRYRIKPIMAVLEPNIILAMHVVQRSTGDAEKRGERRRKECFRIEFLEAEEGETEAARVFQTSKETPRHVQIPIVSK